MVQTQLSECQARVQQTKSLLEEAYNKYAKLINQIDKELEDQILQYVINYCVQGFGAYGASSSELPMVEQVLSSRPHLRPTCSILSYY